MIGQSVTFFLAKLCGRDIKKGVIPISLKRYFPGHHASLQPPIATALQAKQEVTNLKRDLTAVPSLSVYTSQQSECTLWNLR